MTSRDRVLMATNHEEPDRCPCQVSRIDDKEFFYNAFNCENEEQIRQYLGSDLRKNIYDPYLMKKPGLTHWGSVDNWDAGFSADRGGYPLARAQTVADVYAHDWPTKDMVDIAGIKKEVYSIDPQYARLLSLGSLLGMTVIMDLFGMEDALIGLHEESPLIMAALEKVTEYNLETMDAVLKECGEYSDFMWLGDDFSTQRGLMISPEVWRKTLKPMYAKLFELVKSYDVKVWFHSCGTFRPVFGDLVDVGMDVWETVQAHIPDNDPEYLKREYGKDISFFGAVSSQGTIPFGTPEDVRNEVRERFRVLGKGGGYIIGVDHSIQKNMPPENLFALFDEAKKCVY